MLLEQPATVSKYFPVAVEDVRLGYVICMPIIKEGGPTGEMGRVVIDVPNWAQHLCDILDGTYTLNPIVQSKFLEIEDVEKEGWDLVSQTEDEWEFKIPLEGTHWWELSYFPDEMVLLLEYWTQSDKLHTSDCFTKYEGKCRDINDFRLIMKMVKEW